MSAPLRELLTNGRKPRYMQLAEALRSEIVSGEIRSDQFPTETALCERWGVSRFTVREALRTLQQEGLIKRRQGSGTVIRPPVIRRGALHQPLSNIEEILQYARDTHINFKSFGAQTLPRKLADELSQSSDQKWLHFRGLRLREGEQLPIASTAVYIHRDLSEAVARMDLSRGLVFRELEQMGNVRVRSVTQDIQAVAASAMLAEQLQIGRRAACLRIVRCYFDGDDRLLQISVSHHPGDRFAYCMHIEAES